MSLMTDASVMSSKLADWCIKHFVPIGVGVSFSDCYVTSYNMRNMVRGWDMNV